MLAVQEYLQGIPVRQSQRPSLIVYILVAHPFSKKSQREMPSSKIYLARETLRIVFLCVGGVGGRAQMDVERRELEVLSPGRLKL